MDSPQRYGMVIRLRPERRDEYLRLHSAVWPGAEQAMLDANMRNFTIFRHGDLLFGYYEYIGDDHDADQARIAADPESQRWWTLTDPCQEPMAPAGSGLRWAPMQEVSPSGSSTRSPWVSRTSPARASSRADSRACGSSGRHSSASALAASEGQVLLPSPRAEAKAMIAARSRSGSGPAPKAARE